MVRSGATAPARCQDQLGGQEPFLSCSITKLLPEASQGSAESYEAAFSLLCLFHFARTRGEERLQPSSGLVCSLFRASPDLLRTSQRSNANAHTVARAWQSILTLEIPPWCSAWSAGAQPRVCRQRQSPWWELEEPPQQLCSTLISPDLSSLHTLQAGTFGGLSPATWGLEGDLRLLSRGVTQKV